MSNRLSFAHRVPRHEAHEVFAAPAPAAAQARGFGRAALHWVRGVMANDESGLSAAMRRDVGLPELTAAPFAYDAERSRVRV
jgi:hypothetical protein